MARYLAIFTDNHGEEFDVHGFKIMTEKELSIFEEIATSITWEFSYYANNESLNYSNGDDYLSRIEFKEISKDEYDTIEKLFGGEFGTFINEDYLKTVLDGDENYNDRDDEFDGYGYEDDENDENY
jgi:hypothetical protein